MIATAPSGEQVTCFSRPERNRRLGGFCRTHDAMIECVVRKYTIPWAELDDLIQEVWTALLSELPGFQLDPARGPLRAWVLSVAHHAAAKEARRLSRDRADVLTPEAAAALVDPRPGPATLLDRGWIMNDGKPSSPRSGPSSLP